MKKKKSNILYKSVGFIVILAVVIVVIIAVSNVTYTNSYNEFSNSSTISPDVLGYETFTNILNNDNKVSCNDAKKFAGLFRQVNKELKKDNDFVDDNLSNYAVSTPAKQTISQFSDNLISVLKQKYNNKDTALVQAVLQQITQEIYINIALTALMVETGNITEQEFKDFIDITYCGVTPPPSYISPHDIIIYSVNEASGRKAIESINDNISTNK